MRESPAHRYCEVREGTGCQEPRRAHNPKVAGSNPAPATTQALVTALLRPGLRRSEAQLLTDLLTADSAQGGIRRSSEAEQLFDRISQRLRRLSVIGATLKPWRMPLQKLVS